jgi:SulP family sulfate permease
LLSNLSAGLVAGVNGITTELSLAALIFSGPLAASLSTGIGLMLVGGIVFLLVMGFTSSLRGLIAGPQDSPAAILALMAAAIVRGMPASASAESVVATVAAAIALASLLTGLFLLLLGQLRSGNLARFIPYPVVGGFLAGTGWLLTIGAFDVMTGLPFTLAALPRFFQVQYLGLWLPGLVLGAGLVWATRRFTSPLIIPAALLGSVGLFYVWLAVTRGSVADPAVRELLLQPLPSGVLWKPLTPASLAQVDWRLVLGQGSQIGMILIMSVLSLLLNAGAIELALCRDMDLNRELRSAGMANLVAGVLGGPAGFHYSGDTALVDKMGGRSRLAVVVASLMCAAMLVYGASVLSYLPKLLLGGVLLFSGLSFLAEWVYDAWFKLPHTDYFLVLLILGVVGAVGFLQGVALGIGIALLLFVLKYSRVNVVKNTLTGAGYHSTVDRPLAQRQLLRDNGHKLYVLQLQGFIFFGTAQAMLDRIRERLAGDSQSRPSYLVLDFRRVSGFDSSAVSTFLRLRQLCADSGVQLLFTQLSADMMRQIEQGGLSKPGDQTFRTFTSLDHGVEWCEEQILAAKEVSCKEGGGLEEQVGAAFASPGQGERFVSYLERMDLPSGHTLFRQGDPSDAMYFIDVGSAIAELELSDGRTLRLRSMLCGTVVGEVSVFLGDARTATVVTAQPSTLYRLSLAAMGRMEAEDPEIAAALNRWMACLMADRLAENNTTLVAVLD